MNQNNSGKRKSSQPILKKAVGIEDNIVEEQSDAQRKIEDSNAAKAIGYNNVTLFLVWAFALIFLGLSLLLAGVFVVYLYYIVNPNVIEPPMKIENFLSLTWDIISAGTVATTLSVFLPRVISHVSSSSKKGEK